MCTRRRHRRTRHRTSVLQFIRCTHAHITLIPSVAHTVAHQRQASVHARDHGPAPPRAAHPGSTLALRHTRARVAAGSGTCVRSRNQKPRRLLWRIRTAPLPRFQNLRRTHPGARRVGCPTAPPQPSTSSALSLPPQRSPRPPLLPPRNLQSVAALLRLYIAHAHPRTQRDAYASLPNIAALAAGTLPRCSRHSLRAARPGLSPPPLAPRHRAAPSSRPSSRPSTPQSWPSARGRPRASRRCTWRARTGPSRPRADGAR